MLTFTTRCTMNEAPLAGEGGRVVLRADTDEVHAEGFRQVEIILNAATDAAMAPFPESRGDRVFRAFRVTIEEITAP